MRHSALYTLVISILISVLAPVCICAQNYPFRSGEKASIIIHYKCGFSADLAQIDLTTTRESNGGNPYFHVVANASTYKGADTFFKVRDLYESKFYEKDMSPLYFHRDVQEGKYWAKNWYDWKDDGKQLHAIVDKRNRPHRDTLYTADVVIRDIINLFYDARAMDFKAFERGSNYSTLLAMDKDIMKVILRYMGKEQKKIPDLGTFNTIKIGITIIPVTPADKDDDNANNSLIKFEFDEEAAMAQMDESVYYGKEKIFIWLSDDGNRLPLYFSSPVVIGSVNGRLSSYSGLKYPLTSKVK